MIIDDARTIIEPIIQTGALEDLEESNSLLEGTNVVPKKLKSKCHKKLKNELK